MSLWATIEIPQGLKNKYELDSNGKLLLDWVANRPFPANYGSIEGALAEDGDELDVLVVTDEPLLALSRVEIRPLGYLKMIDNGEVDNKLLAVALNDSTKASLQSIADFEEKFLVEIQEFFQAIKDFTNTPVQFSGWGTKGEVDSLIAHCQQKYQGRK